MVGVIACAAGEGVVRSVGRQGVASTAAGHILNIADAIRAGGCAGVQVDRHRSGVCRIAQQIGATLAVQGAAAALQCRAIDKVESVCTRATQQVFNRREGQHIAAGIGVQRAVDLPGPGGQACQAVAVGAARQGINIVEAVAQA